MALRDWLKSVPNLPQVQNPMLVRLSWAHLLNATERNELLANYQAELKEHLELLRGQASRVKSDASLEKQIAEHWIFFYELELAWISKLKGSS